MSCSLSGSDALHVYLRFLARKKNFATELFLIKSTIKQNLVTFIISKKKNYVPCDVPF